MLTKKQHELLMFLNGRLKESGVSPSYDEMKDALGLKSKSGIHRLITGLEERGFIRRLPHRARALEVVKLPESASAGPLPVIAGKHEARPNVIEGRFTPRLARTEPEDSSEDSTGNSVASVRLPLYGRIAAGSPIEALSNPSESIEVPAAILGHGRHFALEVTGDSMIGAGIHDGDTALIERLDTTESGTIVVALIDNEEVTLKRLRRKGDRIALEPANPKYETRIFGPDRVSIQGRLVGLYRRY
jgi:repressor LexA